MSKQRIAILFQVLPPPVIEGQRKSMKPGGYSDSGADIGFALKTKHFDILTPVASPDPTRATDWVFPDTAEGIDAAIKAGATVLWANTVLFSGHPLERVMDKVSIVGQLPASVQKIDDKFLTNRMLREQGLPVARSFLLGDDTGADIALKTLDETTLKQHGLTFPIIIKPIRGRGSQGVTLTKTLSELKTQAENLINTGEFGTLLIIEEYLRGQEVTITVMPPSSPRPPALKETTDSTSFWGLRPVCRFNHSNGVAPYNGAIAVSQNSRAITSEELAQPAVTAMLTACAKAAALTQARAPIRIDCRADGQGVYRLFDLNMKPNMTGAGRPGREDQNSLSAIAAQADGWSYTDLLEAMLDTAWQAPSL